MAFGRRKYRILKRVILSSILLTIIGGSCFGAYYLYRKEVSKIEKNYREEIEKLKMDKYMKKREVFKALKNISAGTRLKSSDVERVDIYANIEKGQLMTVEDFEKVAQIDLKPGDILYKNMLTDEQVDDSQRIVELNMLLLQSKLGKNDYIDLRIIYPNGEDYIVLSKKKIRRINLAQNTIWIWVNEKENALISSAIIDTYIHKGSKIYTTKYIKPTFQEKSVVTYIPNEEVIRSLMKNPNVISGGYDEKDLIKRKKLLENLNLYTAQKKNMVNSKVAEEKNNQKKLINVSDKKVNGEATYE